MEVGGIEPPTRIVAQGLTCHCDQIVTLFSGIETANVDWSSQRNLRERAGLTTCPVFKRLICVVLLDQQHLLRLHHITSLEAIEIHTGRDRFACIVVAIPLNPI